MSSTLNGLPVWVRSVATVGFPIVVAVFLLGAITGVIPSAVSKEHADIQTTQERVRTDLLQQDKARLEALKQQQAEQRALLQLICINTAKSESAATACLQIR